ncbi:MAG TPA: hypothetical protein VFX92_11970 [Candidatus Krumholzibacteria bacterium]|nr:hypothetical protein [Candidatus Krumholzibacteria bacterium]
MKRHLSLIAIVGVILSTWAGGALAGSKIGGGIHYLHNLGDIKDAGLEQDSFSLLGSYQFAGPLLKFEGDVEYIFNFAGTDKSMWQPQAWVLVGGLIYAGGGIGIGYIDGDWQNDPFYALRGGVDLALASFDLDLYASYRFQSDDDLKNLTGEDWDSITFAALLRFGL